MNTYQCIFLQKETEESVIAEIKRCLQEKVELDGYTYYSHVHGVNIRFKTYFTMIDSGAVNKATGNTDQAKCRICRKRCDEYR